MTKNPVTWFEIYVDDMDRAKAFYETVLGKSLEHSPMPEEMNMTMVMFPMAIDGPNASGALVKSDMNTPSSAGTIVYFDSEDCSELSRVESAGGKILVPKSPAGEWGFFCIFTDSEGNNVGFFSQK